MTTKRAINLGCGTITLPRAEKPPQHYPIPDEVYFGEGVRWDNVDRHPAPGVTHLENLWAYPWALPDNTYDYAVVSHIAEHIPHEIIWNGRDWAGLTLANAPQSIKDTIQFFGGVIVPPGTLAEHQGGWYAWFSELWRILKPDGLAFVLVPYAFSNGAVAEPTHTRYCIPASFNYLTPSGDFITPLRQKWSMDYNQIVFQPHEHGVNVARAEVAKTGEISHLLQGHMIRYLNVMFGFMMTLTAVKDEIESQSRSRQGSSANAAQLAGVAS